MELSHFDQAGNAIMVDVTGKEVTTRTALAQGSIKVSAEIIETIKNGTSKKGDVLGVARVAGIMATKRTCELIPMCHPLALNKCSIDFDIDENVGTVTAVCTVRTDGKTGVEMEALTGVSVTLLAIYDMCKAIDKRMCIENIHLVSKQGGKSGDFSYDS